MNLMWLTSRLFRSKNTVIKVRHLSEQVKLQKPVLRFPGARKLPNAPGSSLEHDDDEMGIVGYLLIGIPVIAFGLGTWQVYRWDWKLKLIDQLKTRVSSTPVPLPADLNELEKMEFVPVKVRGRFLYDKEFNIGPKQLVLKGAPASSRSGGGGLSGMSSRKFTGFWVVTPFKLEDRDVTILVNRGWLKTKLENTPKENLGHVSGVTEITGLVRIHEKRPAFMPKNNSKEDMWYYRDLKAMSQRHETDPVYLDLIEECGVDGGPIPGQTIVTLRNEHLSYIITWYSLAAFTGWMYYKKFIKKPNI